MTQDELFRVQEADAYFLRNAAYYQNRDFSNDPPIRLLELFNVRPRRVLDVGAVNGCRAAAIADRFGAQATAVELSGAAIADGRERFPGVRFIQAEACSIPLDEQFDLAVIDYVLHWVDRSTLLRSMAELDRLIADDGLLLLGDFAPANLLRVPYHHQPEGQLYTYKQNYAAILLASGLYHQVGFLSYKHGVKEFAPDVQEEDRGGISLLQKSLQGHYVLAQRGTS